MAWRFELKYLVDTRAAVSLRRAMTPHLVPGEFVGKDGGYPVLSQYFDGVGLPAYLDKVAGVESRWKVRLRTYGFSFRAETPWFLEIKRKENSSISKIRVRVSPDDVDPVDPASWGDAEAMVPFAHVRDLVKLRPTAQVWYHRDVLQSPAGDLRVTWDHTVRGLYPGEIMERSKLFDDTRAVFPDRYTVLEIKTAQVVPTWLVEIIRTASITPEAVSKYALAMNALSLSRRVLATC